MLNIIICENNEYYKKKTFQIIDDYMKKTNIKYKTFIFEDYTDRLKSIIKNPLDGHNIYIIDIHLSDEQSGLDIINDIRKKDYDSQIILETGYETLLSEAQRLRLSILGYVLKMVNYEENILKLLETCLNIFNLQSSLKFRYDKIDYNIKYDDILYILSDAVERKCMVTTKNNVYDVRNPMYFFEQQLNSHFFKINRGCIINVDNASEYNYKENIITFCNGKKLVGMISNKKVKGLKEYVRNN